MTEKIDIAVEKIDNQLKEFQASSVEYVLKQLYSEKRNKVLVADEVGLGKTIIAKGVIAKAIKAHKPEDRPFHVVYICSNQVLAQQNLSKLNPIGYPNKSLSRLIYLAYETNEKADAILKLSSLTPSTSFKLTNSVGTKYERAILYTFLLENQEIESIKEPIYSLLQTKVIGDDSWRGLSSRYIQNKAQYFKPDIAEKFNNHLKSVEFKKSRFPKMAQYLNQNFNSFFDAIVKLNKKLNTDSEKDPKDFSYEVIRALRTELTHVCLDYLDADLFILDEFQRFKSLLDGEDTSEAGEIAKIVLRDDKARVLLLSATPFKPFTTQLEQLNGENHHDEFKKLVEFLGGSKGKDLWDSFRLNQEKFFSILRHPATAIKNPELASESKANLEKSFKQFLSRNERLSVAQEYHNMTLDCGKENMTIIEDDISNYIALDQLVQKLEQLNSKSTKRFGSTMEFSKSAPYPLSFLHGYKLKDIIDDHKTDSSIQSHLLSNKEAFIGYDRINNYKPLGFDNGKATYPNGKLRMLADECFKEKGELLLWVPPSRPYYKVEGVFKEGEDFSKILIFSEWKMAPRAIASLISYEAERRTIANEYLIDTNEKASDREYFNTPRKPAPLLVYKTSEVGEKTTYLMSNFVLTYPSYSLAEISVLKPIESFGEKLSDLKIKQKELIRKLFDKFELIRKYSDVNSNRDDKTWYWITGPLLDRIQKKENKSINANFHAGADWKKGFQSHISNFKKELDAVVSGEKKLGRAPEDLFDVLADACIGSPAINALLTLKEAFPNEEHYEVGAFQIANSFFSLLNKPESICTIRIASKKHEDYWRKTLDYCCRGNFLAMFEEYVYMLKNCNSIDTVEKASETCQNVMSVRTSTIEVDLLDSEGSYESKNMRAHFAVSYGDQKIDSEAGSQRMIGVRDVFNSPFRPFVLASTSIGQEGLDFHFYCRKIFHWNLPHNAINFEQREGRINRFKGLVIRKKLIELIDSECILERINNNENGIWDNIFSLAEGIYKNEESGIKPFWYLDEGDISIERFVPIHKFSKDQKKYNILKTTLALYRMTFGQPRQEELIEAMKSSGLKEQEINELRKLLLINLSTVNSSRVME